MIPQDIPWLPVIVLSLMAFLCVYVPLKIFYLFPRQWKREAAEEEDIRKQMASIDLSCEHCGAEYAIIQKDTCTSCNKGVTEAWKARLLKVCALHVRLMFHGRNWV